MQIKRFYLGPRTLGENDVQIDMEMPAYKKSDDVVAFVA